jgi:hypothetical protein
VAQQADCHQEATEGEEAAAGVGNGRRRTAGRKQLDVAEMNEATPVRRQCRGEAVGEAVSSKLF